MSEIDVDRAHVVIDGFNVLHAVLLTAERSDAKRLGHDAPAPEPLNWWQTEYQRRVVTWAEVLWRTMTQTRSARADSGAGLPSVQVTVVFDASRELNAEQRVTSEFIAVVYAVSADEWIVDRCRHEQVVVVTADRALVNRARMWGARGVKPWAVHEEWGLEHESLR